MKRLVIFLLAIGLGSLTVIGQEEQEDDKNRALKDRIKQLTAELDALQKNDRRADDRKVVLESYDISDLCSPVRDAWMDPTILWHSEFAPEPDESDRERRSPYSVDVIIEIARSVISPATWDEVEGADIQPKNTRLFVWNVPSVHRQFPIFFEQLRDYLDAQVAVDIVALPLSDATAKVLADRPRELTAEETAQLFVAEPLGVARVLCLDGQQVVQRNGRQVNYLADYDVKTIDSAAMGDPIRTSVFAGCSAEVRACLDRKGNGVVLHCLIELSKLAEPVRQQETAHGPLDLPALDLTRLHTSLWAPLGRTVVLGAGRTGKQGCVFLATARRVSAAK